MNADNIRKEDVEKYTHRVYCAVCGNPIGESAEPPDGVAFFCDSCMDNRPEDCAEQLGVLGDDENEEDEEEDYDEEE